MYVRCTLYRRNESYRIRAKGYLNYQHHVATIYLRTAAAAAVAVAIAAVSDDDGDNEILQ